METIEINSEMLFDFRKNACENQDDGFDRALWYNKETKEFFTTCESKSTNYTFSDSNQILLLIFINGDNNADGLKAVCEYCSGCNCKEEVFEDCLSEKLDEWYTISAYNWGTGEYEEIEFEEV